MRYFIHLAYNGKPFHGWQIQPNASSVQECLQRALQILLGTPIELVGCGRTDTGVHASDFYAHFNLESVLREEECRQLTYKLNAFLKEDVKIFSVFPVHPQAHTRFDALSRTYRYYVARSKMPFKQDFVHRIFFQPDVQLMNTASQLLFGVEDFTSFSKLHTQTANNNCIVYEAHWEERGEELVFTIKANRFLRNMVRSITGTLLDVGRGKISLEEFHQIVLSKDRSNAGASLPAQALFLEKVCYPETIFQYAPAEND